MTDKKPSTAEIMAMLRKKPADGASAPTPAPAPAVEATAESAPPAAEAAAPVAPSTPAAKPKGTADIMAAIRAKGAVPAAPPAAAATPAPAAGAAAAKPKGTSDIMAAIRAKGAAPAGASAPAAATPVAAVASKAAPAAVATGKSPAEMIKAMRASAGQSAPGAVAAAPEVAAAKPKLPPRAATPAGKAGAGKKQELPRRSFPAALFAALLVPYYMAWTLLSLIGGLWGLGMARFMMPNTVLELPSKFKVGSIGDYPLGTVSEKYKATRAVWIVHTDSYDGQNVIYALLSVCTHLGCTPSWLDAEQKFKCPCHGSGFYINGVNFEGPAPRPLERVGLVLGADGTLEVDKSVKFQEELGQWNDPKSFVKLS